MVKISPNANVYIINIAIKTIKFDYTGYTNLSQIGQYYAVTADDKITRLYTMVNFLHNNNIPFHSQGFHLQSCFFPIHPIGKRFHYLAYIFRSCSCSME